MSAGEAGEEAAAATAVDVAVIVVFGIGIYARKTKYFHLLEPTRIGAPPNPHDCPTLSIACTTSTSASSSSSSFIYFSYFFFLFVFGSTREVWWSVPASRRCNRWQSVEKRPLSLTRLTASTFYATDSTRQQTSKQPKTIKRQFQQCACLHLPSAHHRQHCQRLFTTLSNMRQIYWTRYKWNYAGDNVKGKNLEEKIYENCIVRRSTVEWWKRKRGSRK